MGTVSLRVTWRGKAVNGAHVRATFTMLDMDMASLSATKPQAGAGRDARSTPLLGLSGHWGLRLRVAPRRGAAFSVGVIATIGA